MRKWCSLLMYFLKYILSNDSSIFDYIICHMYMVFHHVLYVHTYIYNMHNPFYHMYLTLFLPAERILWQWKMYWLIIIELISSRWLHNEAEVVYYTEYIRKCIKVSLTYIFNIYSLNVIICMTMEKMSALRVTIRNNAST